MSTHCRMRSDGAVCMSSFPTDSLLHSVSTY
jgi:hypothetical protein